MEHPLEAVMRAAGGRVEEAGGYRTVLEFGDLPAEYERALHGAGICERGRGLIEVTGRDRAAWLHNLVTNAVKTLQPGEGNYAFALNVKGRILFDCNILIYRDAIWIDLDRAALSPALSHLNRYIITEDVQLTDRSDDYARIALVGPRAAEIADALGASHAAAMPVPGLTSATLVQKSRPLVRTDFAGVFGAELFIEAADAVACWSRLLEIGRPVELGPVGWRALEILRIEAGRPAYGRELHDEVLPAETGQLSRAVSFVKGCYLGQEVVERMRSHGAVARGLVSLRLGELPSTLPAPLIGDAGEAGRLTSACQSPTSGSAIGLGYVRAAIKPGTRLHVGDQIQMGVEVLAGPVLPGAGA